MEVFKLIKEYPSSPKLHSKHYYFYNSSKRCIDEKGNDSVYYKDVQNTDYWIKIKTVEDAAFFELSKRYIARLGISKICSKCGKYILGKYVNNGFTFIQEKIEFDLKLDKEHPVLVDNDTHSVTFAWGNSYNPKYKLCENCQQELIDTITTFFNNSNNIITDDELYAKNLLEQNKFIIEKKLKS